MNCLPTSPIDYNKIKVGVKNLEDAVLNLGSIKKANRNFGNKNMVLRALADKDIKTLREISAYFYNTNGIYKSACDYFATLYRYDWYIETQILDEKYSQTKVLKEFHDLLKYLDNSDIRKMCGDIALRSIVYGAYYAYLIPCDDRVVLQELPPDYCRSRYNVGDSPAIEFNMRFFDEQFADINYRLRVLKLFPTEFQKGYLLYKKGKLQPDFNGDTVGSWYLLEPGSTICFSLGLNTIPMCVNSIPAILDLDAAQDLDRRKQMQQLLKILIQKLPTDKNGDLIFDVDEARDIHNNAVEMLSRAIGVDVLTTFADVQVEDIADSSTTTSTDDLEKVERALYNSLGISKNLFNADGNLALTNSILTDESAMRSLLFQLRTFFNKVVQKRNKNKKKYQFKLQMLETTQFNYQALSKLYKEQVQLGYSKMLPQIALGHTQSSIINTAYFENEVLNLSALMVPPMSSNTMNAEALQQSSTNNKSVDISEKTAGREEKPDSEKSDKTIQNRESMN